MINLDKWNPKNKTEVVCQIDLDGQVYRVVSPKANMFTYLFLGKSTYLIDSGRREGSETAVFEPRDESLVVSRDERDTFFVTCCLIHRLREAEASGETLDLDDSDGSILEFMYMNQRYRIRYSTGVGRRRLRLDREKRDSLGESVWKETSIWQGPDSYYSDSYMAIINMLFLSVETCLRVVRNSKRENTGC